MAQNSSFARKLVAYVDFSPGDLSDLEAFHNRRRKYLAGQDLIPQGQNNQSAFILVQGWA